MRKVKIGINVRFNEREKAENPGLGSYGVIDVEVYTGDLDNDRSEMEYDDADSLEAAVEQARGLEAETDIDDGTDPKRFSQEEAETSGDDTPIQEDFLHAPNRPGAALVGENRRLYTLGRMLEEDCPDNDCRVYLNIFHMAQEADAALGVLDGYAAQVMARDLRRSLSELWDMYLTNDAIFRYRQGRSGKQTISPAGHDSPYYPGEPEQDVSNADKLPQVAPHYELPASSTSAEDGRKLKERLLIMLRGESAGDLPKT